MKDMVKLSMKLVLGVSKWSAQVVMHQTAVCGMKSSLPEVDQQ